MFLQSVAESRAVPDCVTRLGQSSLVKLTYGRRFRTAAPNAEIRVPSGAIANLYAFMVAAKAGDSIIAPPPSIGGHVTHHAAGSAGMYGLITHPAPADAKNYTIDVDALRDLARKVKPKMITVGASLNLQPHPVWEIRAIADEIGALVLFDAAHLCGMIATATGGRCASDDDVDV